MNHAQAAANLRKQIAELEKMAQEHEAQVVTDKADEWPQIGDAYWVVDFDGDIFKCAFANSVYEEERLATGNCFRTEAEAIRRLESLKVQTELRRMPGRCAFEHASGEQFFIYFDEFGCCFEVGRNESCEISRNDAIAGVWFATIECACHALDTIGQERLRVYLDDFLQTPIKEVGAE